MTHRRTEISLPARYDVPWRQPFGDAIDRRLTDGCRILDIGSGRSPSVAADRRPLNCEYIGLDIAADELRAAGTSAYTDIVVADITQQVPELLDRFDLAISWQVLEHVRPVSEAVQNIHSYLREAGMMISLLSGKFAAFALANRILPNTIGHAVVTRTMSRTAEKTPVFPAYYDRCYATGLRRVFAQFREVTLMPFYRGANYFNFSRVLMKTYLAYENRIYRRDSENLASHYLIIATR